MNDDFLEMLEPTPKLKTKKCKIISMLIWIFLKFSIYIITIISWLMYDYFIAFFTLILSYVIVGIIRAKLRNSVIPMKQREYHYNDKDIANWYTAKAICDDELEQKLELIK